MDAQLRDAILIAVRPLATIFWCDTRPRRTVSSRGSPAVSGTVNPRVILFAVRIMLNL